MNRTNEEPAQFSVIKDELFALNDQIKTAQSSGHADKRLNEALWPTLRLNTARTRLVYNACASGAIDRDTLEYCAAKGWADRALISKWKKPGYQNLCCVLCVQAGAVCVCRVPGKELQGRKHFECQNCGCSGCS